MRALPTSLVLAVVLLAGCEGKNALLAPKYEDEGVQWGEARDGLQVGLARRNYVEGKEPGRGQEYFAIHLRNVGSKTVSVLSPVAGFGTIPEELGGDETVSVVLTYDSAAGVKTGEFRPFKKPVVQTLGPGEGFKMELRLAPGRFGLDRFLSGRMTATYANGQGAIKYKSVGDAETSGLWTGSVTSGAVLVEHRDASTRPTKAPAAPERVMPADRAGGAS